MIIAPIIMSTPNIQKKAYASSTEFFNSVFRDSSSKIASLLKLSCMLRSPSVVRVMMFLVDFTALRALVKSIEPAEQQTVVGKTVSGFFQLPAAPVAFLFSAEQLIQNAYG